MSAPMTAKWQASASKRAELYDFLTFAKGEGCELCTKSELLHLHEEVGMEQIASLLDGYLGIDRAQLNAERAAQLSAGGSCDCDS